MRALAVVLILCLAPTAWSAPAPSCEGLFAPSGRLTSVRDNRARDFFLNPEEPTAWAERALLKDGLKSRTNKDPRLLEAKIRALLKTRAMRTLWSLLTAQLPTRDDRPMSTELLAKIMTDGIDAHIGEIREAYAYNKQKNIDTYRRVNKALKYLMLTVNVLIFGSQAQTADDQQKALELQESRDFDRINKNFDDLDKAIDAI